MSQDWMTPARVRIGKRLHTARIERGISIEETAWRTRIRPYVLRALEDEEFDLVGHYSIVRSHLLSYARFLGMDPTAIIGEYEKRLGNPPSAIEELDQQLRIARKPPRAKWLIASSLSGVVLIGASIVGMLGGQAERPKGDVSALGIASPRLDARPSRDRAVPAAEARVRLQVRADESTALTVIADGTQVFDGTIRRGASKVFRARGVLEIIASNGDALELELNGEHMRAGRDGSVFRARFGPHGRLPS